MRRRNVLVEHKSNSNTLGVTGTRYSTEERKKSKSYVAFLHQWEFLIAPVIFTTVSSFTRMWKIGLSPVVIWDEAYFGHFGSAYLKREFYFDVHPPLGKLLIAFSGLLAGYDGSFPFGTERKYTKGVDYTSMRLLNASFGAFCIPLAYFTVLSLRFQRPTVWLVTLMVLCETSYATISRFILLDSILLFFTFTTVFCWARLYRLEKENITLEQLTWLFLTGVSIGCVCSVKWAGLFSAAFVGVYTIEDSWNKSKAASKTKLLTHLSVRTLALIVTPVVVYIFFFYLHFLILANSGPHDAYMSSLFQANLKGNDIGKDCPWNAAYGSRFTLRNMGYGGGVLHSNLMAYPGTSNAQMQVMGYHIKGPRAHWVFYPSHNDSDVSVEDPVRLVSDGDVLRIIHALSGRNLHSSPVAAPITTSDYRISGYGSIDAGDENDHWTIEVVSDPAKVDDSKVRTLTTAFRLKHTSLGCYLRGGILNLPAHPYNQIEITCVKDNRPRDRYTHWNIEDHWNSKRKNPQYLEGRFMG